MSQQYPQQSPPPPEGQKYDNYETQSPPGVAPAPPQGPAGAGRKKRAYAGQAYEFGAGANSALGGQQQGGAAAPSYSGFSAQQDAAGYPQGGYQQNPTAVQQTNTPMYPQDGGSMGGYQPPQPAYPTQPPQHTPSIGGVTQQFNQMNVSQTAHQPQQQPQAPQAKAPVLNQLYPTDLSNQPFNVAELDYPPPPAVLPPNVSICDLLTGASDLFCRPVSLHHRMQIALLSMSDLR